MRQSILVALLTLFLIGCSGEAQKPGPEEVLSGKWVSSLMTAEFDFKEGTYKTFLFGEEKIHKMEIVSEKSNIITFKSDGETLFATVNDDGSITIGKEGGIPVKLVKQD